MAVVPPPRQISGNLSVPLIANPFSLMPPFVADLHIHSHYSRATSRDLDLEHLAEWAQRKGVQVLATGDIAHPGWLAEIKAKLVPAEEGLFRLREEIAAQVAERIPAACHAPVRFLLGGEVSNIYKRDGQVRKVHHLLFMPSLAAVERLQAALERIGNIRSDGRPILGLDSRDLLEIVLETDAQGYLIPAHIWTPWFAILGSKSGFDTIEACFGDLTSHIFAVETGLSSDPPMNWTVSQLDKYTLISNSDAHSPPKLAREATLFSTEYSYAAIFDALRTGDPTTFAGTLEFFPEEGKYHADGHRQCGVRWEPAETFAHGAICSVCGRPVTVGVMNRIASLADRPFGVQPAHAAPYQNLIALPEILGEVFGVGAGSKRVQRAYEQLLAQLGPELAILRTIPLDEIQQHGGEMIAEGIRRMRAGEVQIEPGYDGEYGVIKLFTANERAVSTAQMDLFGRPAKASRARRTQPNPEPAAANTATTPQKAPKRAAPSSGMPPLLQGLNPEQLAAARLIDAPLLIVAGPGTGKTRTLTQRIAHLVRDHAVDPRSILAITFTNKAATELAERLAHSLAEAARSITVQTFHAFAAAFLREHGAVLGIPETFVIASDEDRAALLRQLYSAWSEKMLNAALAAISAAKNELRAVEEIPATEQVDGTSLAEIYGQYEAGLRQNHLLDFDDLLLLTVRILESDAAIQQQTQARYRWISVDEYQDINLAQYRLLRLLTAGENPPNLCAIGDPDQAIYGFRGSDRAYFLRFTTDFPDAQVLRLQQNYRSTPAILAAASQVIALNPDDERLAIWSSFIDETKLDLHSAPTDKAEAEYVVHQIEQMVGGTSLFSLDSGRVGSAESAATSFGDFAVLYRTSAQSGVLIEALTRSGIPFQTVGQTSLTGYQDVREVLAYLHLAYDADAALYRELIQAATPKRSHARIATFLQTVTTERAALPVTELIERVLQFWQTELHRTLDDKSSERMDRLRLRALPFANRLGDFLNALALQREVDEYDPRADRVTLMTLHAAKGLEFPIVFLVGCEENLLPLTLPGRATDVEEERRLFYVGMTRAQQKLILSHARNRFLFGQAMDNPPSRFVNDIAQTLTEIKRMAERKPLKEKPELQQLSLF